MTLGILGHIGRSLSDAAQDVGLLALDIPERLSVRPVDPWKGCATAGAALCDGVFIRGEEQLSLHGECWEPVASAAWLDHLHSFNWLRDLRACGNESARQQARALIASWVRQYPKFHALAWRHDLMGARVANMIALHEFFHAPSDDDFNDLFFESLVRQGRALSRGFSAGATGLAQLQVIKGLLYAGLSLEGYEAWAQQALTALDEELARQILADGGHVSRSPVILMEALQLLIDMRTALITAGWHMPESLSSAIEYMAPALRFFRHGDKGFALVNGAQWGDQVRADQILAQAGVRSKRLNSLERSGFERVVQGRTLVMFDCGRSPSYPYDLGAHAAPLSFEMSYGKERIFVNCGSHPHDPMWRDALRATAAHNTLSIDHRNACEIREDGSLARRVRMVDPVREETRENCLLESSHDGYAQLNGITHRRRLFLTGQGHDLRGEDTLGSSGDVTKPHEIAVRFHIHPRVNVSLIQDGEAALLRLRSGVGWRFSFSGGSLALEDSIYLGEGAEPRKTKQLVIYGDMVQHSAQIKWALQREGLKD